MIIYKTLSLGLYQPRCTSHPPRAYGVLGIISSLEEMMGPSLPKIVDATLLPFKNSIIYDGTLSSFNTIFGSSIRRSIDDSYRQAKGMGIITACPYLRKMSNRTIPRY